MTPANTSPMGATGGGAASLLGPILRRVCRGELPVRLRAWDGSETGPPGTPVLVLRDKAALRRLLWHPVELGLAQGYVTGEIDVDGDLPPQFWELILGPSMAYSCAWWRSRTPGYDLADAQRDKLDLICRKLALHPGSRLLDLGCGWGPLACHAASRHDAEVTAVTLSGRQAKYVRRRAAAVGLAGRVHVRAVHYRDLGPSTYDAIACVETGEYVGARDYPAFCAQLASLLRPGGRLLIQQMARGSRAPGARRFIESFITAGMHTRPAGETIALLEDADLEVCRVDATRADYVRTLRSWQRRLDRNLDQVTALIGGEKTRSWQVCVAGAVLAFEQEHMNVHQILATRGSRQVRAGRRSFRPPAPGQPTRYNASRARRRPRS